MLLKIYLAGTLGTNDGGDRRKGALAAGSVGCYLKDDWTGKNNRERIKKVSSLSKKEEMN